MKHIIKQGACFLMLFIFIIPIGYAQLSVSPIFSSDMVLQRGTTVPVFGTADPGATVNVQFLSQNKSVVADNNGNWQVDLTSMAANASMNTMTVTSGSSSVSFTGVQVGEVWLCSGQSNMGWSMQKADDSAPYIADASNHNIRLFRMTAGNGPETTNWKVSNSTTVADFSAVGYWMGLELSQWFGNVPVGLIQATHDGTAIDQWQHTHGGSGVDYDAMVKAIQPFVVKGVAWYQGESNGGDSDYDVKLTDMISEWRSDWGLPDLPFGINQLAGTSRSGGARLGQFIVSQTVPNTFLVVIADLPGGNQLHPTTKRPVGLRTAIGARGAVYGENIPYSGPVYDADASYVSGSTVVLNWDFVGNGLITSDGLAPSTFEIAGPDGRFKSATASIVGNTVQVSNSTVSSPAKVRYQFGSVGNFYNSVSIPVEGGASTVDMLPTSMFEYVVGAGSGNQPPLASFTYTSSGLSASFDGSGSSDSDGSVVSYQWDFGDGASGNGVQANHTYAASGTYTVVLTVTDDGGATASDSQSVTVSDGSGGGASLHVQNLITYATSAGQGNKQGVAEVTVHDDQENPVSGATVSGSFSGSFNETASGVTGADGKVVLTTNGTAKGGVVVDFCVDQVTHSSLSYNSSQNDITCTTGSARLDQQHPNAIGSSILMYPNPIANGYLTISLPENFEHLSEMNVRIISLQGAMAYSQQFSGSREVVLKDLQLKQGIYLVEVEAENVKHELKLFVR